MNKQYMALRSALDALQLAQNAEFYHSRQMAIEEVQDALSEPMPEPVAYVDRNFGILRTPKGIDLPSGTKLYTAPPACNPLIDELLSALENMLALVRVENEGEFLTVEEARATIAKVKEST